MSKKCHSELTAVSEICVCTNVPVSTERHNNVPIICTVIFGKKVEAPELNYKQHLISSNSLSSSLVSTISNSFDETLFPLNVLNHTVGKSLNLNKSHQMF